MNLSQPPLPKREGDTPELPSSKGSQNTWKSLKEYKVNSNAKTILHRHEGEAVAQQNAATVFSLNTLGVCRRCRRKLTVCSKKFRNIFKK